MKTFILSLIAVAILFTGCDKPPFDPEGGGGIPQNQAKKYPADVAVEWINLQQHLIKTTPGFDPLVASRSFAYSGLALYESIVKGMPGHKSLASPRIGMDINGGSQVSNIHWAASANAAMASILKDLFANTSDANKQKIDSLESAIYSRFQPAPQSVLASSAEYGKAIAGHIFEWSKTDGGHEAYLSAVSPDYVSPVGPGLWVSTSPAFPQPIRPFWGHNRTFVLNSAVSTRPPLPPTYSEEPGSSFYKMAEFVYTKSLTLTSDDIAMVKTWGDLPGNYGTPAHYTHIATQLIQQGNFTLDKAAFAYAKHGIALYEATICVFNAKYTYILLRPITYIRNVMGHTNWNTVIGTPPHPEYPSAHAVIGGASYVVLESFFGKNHSFTDRTHENLYGARTYATLKEYAVEASWSRVLAGIHFNPAAKIGLEQGEKVGKLVNALPFK